jgi:hypothetical protein
MFFEGSQMRRRDFLYSAGGLVGLALGPTEFSVSAAADSQQNGPADKIVGMYIHQHWPYKHPYAARTWTIDNYSGYADGLKRLGYNMVMIWPVLETMPNPLTPSDAAELEKISKVIDILHREFQMQAYIALCPNVGARNEEATEFEFEKRHFFYCDMRVDPGDPVALGKMIQWRESLLRPLAQMDGVLLIDSDPGGYAGSNNAEFVTLFGEHRKMLNRLRPGIELYYWMHQGWEGYCRLYQTADFGSHGWGTPQEAEDMLARMKRLDPKPWGITIHTVGDPPNGTNLKMAEKFGLAANALAFNYNAIEYEPSFPMTNFGDDNAYNSGRALAPGGTIANAQTHCAQLPNTFAFAQGALGRARPTESDYAHFGDALIPRQGGLIAQAWELLPSKEVNAMRATADRLEAVPPQDLTPGPLKGLLLGDAHRFMNDLAMILRLKAAYVVFVRTMETGSDSKKSFHDFVTAVERWQARHGYEGALRWPGFDSELRKLNSPAINAVLDEKPEGSTPYDRVEDRLRKLETFTARLLEAMKKTAQGS